jgi:hypothetical protein
MIGSPWEKIAIKLIERRDHMVMLNLIARKKVRKREK